MEYFKLLNEANQLENSMERLAYITAFNLSQFCNIEGRSLKPFNPVLGETYELLTNDFKFMAEQVSHHPPISACCGYNANFEMWGDTEVVGQFKKRQLRFKAVGQKYVKLKRTEEKFTMECPTISVHNLILGEMYLDLCESSVMRNVNTGETCEVTFF